jgi:hypothetical protein
MPAATIELRQVGRVDGSSGASVDGDSTRVPPLPSDCAIVPILRVSG